MLIRQSKSSFIRHFSGYSYIENQVTHLQRLYRHKEHDVLMHLNRVPRSVEGFIKLCNGIEPLFIDTFLEELISLKFVVVGETKEDLDEKDLKFSHATKKDIETQFSILQLQNKQPLDHLWLKRIEIELTPRCNERCLHCYIPNSDKDKGGYMSFTMFKNIIDQFAEFGGISVIISGGEPFIHKDVCQMLSYCREKDLMITILSNLTHVSKTQIDFLKSIDIFMLQTSIYSMKSETHDYITRRKGSFDKTIGVLEELVMNNIPIMISCPIMNLNVEDYENVKKYANNIGAEFTSDYILLAQYNKDDRNLNVRMTTSQLKNYFENLINSSDYYSELIYSARTEDELLSNRFAIRKTCNVLQSDLCISSNGDFFPCPSWQDYKLGNINECGIKDIWLKSEKTNNIRNIKREDFIKCRNCNLTNFCEMCMVYNYNENKGNYLEVSKRFCKSAEIFRDVVINRYRSYAKNN